MTLGNNIENYAFEKGGWTLIETSADGNVIYMGKGGTLMQTTEPVWCIKAITKTLSRSGGELISIGYVRVRDGNIAHNLIWQEKEDYVYE